MTTHPSPLRLGTRNSKLALRQADIVRNALIAADPSLAAPERLMIVPMQSAGDWRPADQERSFADMGSNKGLFAKELERALQTGAIDLAVHSAKDLETTLATGLELACFLPRDDVRDAFISHHATQLQDLPQGARLGTSSLRRAAQILAVRPDISISPLRGNVDTRLRKLQAGQVDATLLAHCGLNRLEITGDFIHPLNVTDMLPAVAQGALAVEIRSNDHALAKLLQQINCPRTNSCVTLERLFLKHLDGSCRTPVAALATHRADGLLDFAALVALPDGTGMERRALVVTLAEAPAAVAALGTELRRCLPDALFDLPQTAT
jgi:hydroxymethylbilane synthase